MSLQKLSKDFKPENVNFLLALDADHSKEESIDCAEGMVNRLKQFIENGNSTEGLDFSYSKIEIY